MRQGAAVDPQSQSAAKDALIRRRLCGLEANELRWSHNPSLQRRAAGSPLRNFEN